MVVNVFVLDDQEVVRAGLRALIEAEEDLSVVGEAATAEEALSRLPACQPDVAVLDVRLADTSGIEVCRDIRSRWPSVACLMFTSYSDDDAVFSAVMAGASGYLLKEIRGRDVVDAIRKVADGQSLLDPKLTGRVLDRLRHPPPEEPGLASLSRQERRILGHIAEGKTNREIAAEMFLAEKTVKNYVARLLAKLDLRSRTQAAIYAVKLQDEPRSGSDS